MNFKILASFLVGAVSGIVSKTIWDNRNDIFDPDFDELNETKPESEHEFILTNDEVANGREIAESLDKEVEDALAPFMKEASPVIKGELVEPIVDLELKPENPENK